MRHEQPLAELINSYWQVTKTLTRRHRESCKGKLKYCSEEEANRAKQNTELRIKESFEVYQCLACGYWHIGHALRSTPATTPAFVTSERLDVMAKQPSLAAQAGALTQELKLPAVFSAPQKAIVARKLAPYVVFAHSKRADEWAKIQARLSGAATEGNMYFIDGDTVVAVTPAKLSWVCGKQYWASVTPQGEVLSVAYEERPKPFKEHIECVVLCYLEDRVIPCNMGFRSTKCPGAKVLSDAFNACQQPAWAELSPAHKETLVMQQAFCRFYGVMDLAPPKTSKSSGLTYKTTTCSVRPTGVAEWRLLQQLAENPKSADWFSDAAKRYETKLMELDTKVSK